VRNFASEEQTDFLRRHLKYILVELPVNSAEAIWLRFLRAGGAVRAAEFEQFGLMRNRYSEADQRKATGRRSAP
jgi:hypothetical protein